MNKSLPFMEPIESLLSLTPEDKCLSASFQTSSIPPQSLVEACFLTHYIIRQSCYAGTHILDHLLRNPPGNSEHLAPLMLYRHALELGDSIGMLLRFSSATTASILVRSLFETSLGLGISIKPQNPKPKHWYTLSNSDITHLRALAKVVGRKGEYVLLYKPLSGSVHASDLFSGVLEHGEGKSIRVHRMHGPVEKIKETTSLAANLVWSHHHLLNTYLKGHGIQTWFSRWYIEDYSKFFNWAITPGPLFSQPHHRFRKAELTKRSAAWALV